jgi:hypothetical protein
MRSIFTLLGLASAPAAFAGTIEIDGINDFTAPPLSGGVSSLWYVEYDTDKIYFAISAKGVGAGYSTEFVWVYIDTDPAGTAGSPLGVVYNTQEPVLPFSADFHFRWKADNSYTNMLDYNGGSWTSDNLSPNNFGIEAYQFGDYLEFSIPRASLGNPTSIRWVGAMINEVGGAESTYFQTPSTNPSGYDADFFDAHTLSLSAPPGPVAVPVLPVWGLVAMAGLLGAAGAGASGRRED